MIKRVVAGALTAGLLISMATISSDVAAASSKQQNPLTADWTGPHGGLPPFDKVKIADFKPALEEAMAENLKEIDAIANSTAEPTFENVFVALEKTGGKLRRVSTIYGIWASNLNTDDFQKIQAEMNPKLAEHSDKISQNEKLFKRVEKVYLDDAKVRKGETEQSRLMKRYYSSFVRSGAQLGPDQKKRLSEINQALAGHFTNFNKNLLGEENQVWLTLDKEEDLAGLPDGLKNAAAAAAVEKKLPGKWVIKNTRSSVDPFLSYSARRDLREKVWKMFVNRGDNGDSRDNNAIIPQILALRAERAKLLGFPTHAHFTLDNTMAKTPDAAMDLMTRLWPAAVARVKEEVADMQALANKEGAKITIEPWDYRYYMEKVRIAKYDLDQNEVTNYLQLDKMRDAMFWMAGELFNFSFTKREGIPVFHPDVTVYEVKDKTNGKHIGLWYFDPYAREGKRSGAWMNDYREQQRMDGEVTTLVSNNSNFVKGKPGEPVLFSWDDATTMFHEFGHALHGLSSNVTYPTLSGTNVSRDYVEFPSQILEHWLGTPEVLSKFALHYKTGQPIPDSLVAKIKKADTFNQGFANVELLASALVDMKLHLAGDAKIDADKFERDTLAQLGMPREIVMRHRTPHFGHIFSSDGYAAGYYSYVWSVVLAADAYTAFTEAGGPYDKKVGASLKANIFSVGDTVDQAAAFRKFRGRDPNVEALMKELGFPITK